MMQAGNDNDQIKSFLVERYGDFVLYKPQFRSWKILLWLAPAVFVVIGLIALGNIVRRRSSLPIDEDAP